MKLLILKIFKKGCDPKIKLHGKLTNYAELLYITVRIHLSSMCKITQLKIELLFDENVTNLNDMNVGPMNQLP